jgi:HAMP domain-containing protein
MAEQQFSANKRRKFLIDPQFQLTFMAYMAGLSALAIAIFYASNVYFFWRFREMGSAVGLSPDHIFFQFLRDQQTTMTVIFAVTATLAIGTLLVCGLLISHRVAGPLLRLRNQMHLIAEGKASAPVKFRDNDFFQELAEAFNRTQAGSPRLRSVDSSPAPEADIPPRDRNVA